MNEVNKSDDWGYEDLAILSADGYRARGWHAVVVNPVPHEYFVYYWR